MTSLGDPRPLTNEELLDFEQTNRCRNSWYAKSLLLTIQEIREEHYYEMELVRAQRNEAQRTTDWYESTYSERANQPLFPRRRGNPMNTICPHCNKKGETGLGDYRICFECGRTWTRKPVEAGSPPTTAIIPTIPIAIGDCLVTNLSAGATA